MKKLPWSDATNMTAAEVRHIRAFWERKAKAARTGYRIDNSSLYAGSPMHYYCRDCGIATETLPEGHLERPRTTCLGCAWLFEHGLVPVPKLSSLPDLK